MKKQIFILTFLSLAFLMAGVSKSFGQYTNYLTATNEAAIACTPAITLTCAGTDDELHPLPGKVYTYGVTVAPSTYQSIHWFVTDNANVISTQATLTTDIDPVNGDYVLTATSGVYNTPANTTATIDISWKTFPVSVPVLLVAYVKGANGCSDNLEVYRIEPTFGFTLDVAGLLDDGTLGAEECLSPVESASYDGTNLTVNYGENWVFFSVNAANFVGSWEPTISAVVTGGSTIGAVEWAYPADALANTAGAWKASGVPVNARVAGGAVGTGGECIIVRVQVDHAGNELDASVAAAVVTLSVNGVMLDPAALAGAEYDNGNLADLDNPTSGTGSCVNNITDTANYTLTPRPAITTNTTPSEGDMPFEPKN